MGRARALLIGTVALLVGLTGNLLLSGGDRTTTTGGSADEAGAGAAAAATPDVTPPPTPTATPSASTTPIRALGDRTLVGGVLLVLHGVTDPFEGADSVVTAPAGARWVAVDVEVANVSPGTLHLTARHRFALRDATNRRFGPADTVEDLPGLDGPLAAGEERRGTLVFEVPQGAHDLRLAYDGPGGSTLVALG